MRTILLFLALYNCYFPIYSMETEDNTIYNPNYSFLNDLLQVMDPSGGTILDEHFSNIKLHSGNDSSIPSHWQSLFKTHKPFDEDTSSCTELNKLSEQACIVIASYRTSNNKYSNNLYNRLNLLLDEYHQTLQNGIIKFKEIQDLPHAIFYGTKLCDLLGNLGNMLEHVEPQKKLHHIHNLYSIIGQTAATTIKIQENIGINLRKKANQLLQTSQLSIDTFNFVRDCIQLTNIITINKVLRLRELSFRAIRISTGKYSHAHHTEVVTKNTLTDQCKHFRKILCEIIQLHKIPDLYGIIGQICIIEQYNNIMIKLEEMYEQNSKQNNNNSTVECILF